jgi:hypothetical protein
VVSKILSFDWALWFFWIMATTWGWLLGSLLLSGLALITAGLFVGIFQWLVLQGRLVRAWRWIIATSAGWLAGYLITFFLFPVELKSLEGVTIGLITGIAQWVILRREFQWAGWWIIFSLIGWTTGLTLLPGILLTGTMAGALSGICLEVLLRFPKPKPIAANTFS